MDGEPIEMIWEHCSDGRIVARFPDDKTVDLIEFDAPNMEHPTSTNGAR